MHGDQRVPVRVCTPAAHSAVHSLRPSTCSRTASPLDDAKRVLRSSAVTGSIARMGWCASPPALSPASKPPPPPCTAMAECRRGWSPVHDSNPTALCLVYPTSPPTTASWLFRSRKPSEPVVPYTVCAGAPESASAAGARFPLAWCGLWYTATRPLSRMKNEVPAAGVGRTCDSDTL